ncbi:hypothetical protein RM533_07110 [Croceicoccus sp. F390]|uniref:Uncharacterized protein n=1 Tax=Croceicoccus esteveae TaxID=3075597 RepID=A0ABU2ZH71_9SPHN|nr:hypothetical protein [Croceicoccus sp. F390]MDT0575952.1 hypothetical protein [Croceicoccus sp. F390]
MNMHRDAGQASAEAVPPQIHAARPGTFAEALYPVSTSMVLDDRFEASYVLQDYSRWSGQALLDQGVRA